MVSPLTGIYLAEADIREIDVVDININVGTLSKVDGLRTAILYVSRWLKAGPESL